MEDSLKSPRGIRNNNPLNLRKSSNEWLGKIRNGSDKDFEQFLSIEYGIRAAFINMRTILRRKRGCTLEQLIEVWAPRFENHTDTYIRSVVKESGLSASSLLNFTDKEMMCRLARAMAFVEVGQLLDMASFQKAYDMI